MSAFDPYHKWLGIPPEDQPPTHYRLLGINPFESDPDVVSYAADQRMSHIRSFQTGAHSASSQKILNEIATARLCLLNADAKLEYDNRLRAESSQPVLPAWPEPMVASPRENAAKQRRPSVHWMPWGAVAALTSVAVVIIVIAAANRPPASDSLPVTATTTEHTKPRKTDEPRPSAGEKTKPGTTEKAKPKTAPEPVPKTAERPRLPTTMGDETTNKDEEVRTTAQDTFEDPLNRNPPPRNPPPRNPLPRDPPPDVKPNRVMERGMVAWKDGGAKEAAGVFKDVKGPDVLVENEDKSSARIPIKSLIPESQDYVLAEIRNRQGRLFDVLKSKKSEAEMLQDISPANVRVPARISEVLMSKGRALKVKLNFDAFPKQVAARPQMTLRSDPGNFVNIKAGDTIVFEGKLAASVKSCTYCNASGWAKCPACKAKGIVAGPARNQTRTMPDGRSVTTSVPTTMRCRGCDGMGRVNCSHPVPAERDEWTPLERKRVNAAIASVSTSKGLRYLVLELQDMLVCIEPEASREPIYFGLTPGEGNE